MNAQPSKTAKAGAANIMSAQPKSQRRAMPQEIGAARERLRRRYQPARVRMLFVGESPPASGRFFYRADSGLYRAIRRTFLSAFPDLKDADFLESFRKLDCYLVDLCGNPVDNMPGKQRRFACAQGEVRLAAIIRRFNPEVIVTVVRSIAANVERAQARTRWPGTHIELPYPGRWKTHRVAFEQALGPVLRRTLLGRTLPGRNIAPPNINIPNITLKTEQHLIQSRKPHPLSHKTRGGKKDGAPASIKRTA